MASELEKQAAARAALDFVRDGDVVGLGTGTTAAYFIRYLGERVREGLNVRCIPTSEHSRIMAAGLGIPLAGFDQCPHIDVDIDGADEIDPHLQLIKGHGGALLREKVVASASRKVVIIADSSKQVTMLGKFPLPVEVAPFAQALVARRIAALGASVAVRMGMDGRPFVTDEGHHILDCGFGRIADPQDLADLLDRMPGVQEHGIFLGLADVALIGRGDKVAEFHRLGRMATRINRADSP
ncbi:MAG TPA: ribose-5-phosphate isomerase RpiA [Geobacteraceae bacterium]|nr:ribose-5-phosphate isomerase RpiA [Geobacteraceae bacterium]